MNRMGKGQPSWSSTPTRNVPNSLLEYRPNSCCSYTGTEWHITTVKILHTLEAPPTRYSMRIKSLYNVPQPEWKPHCSCCIQSVTNRQSDLSNTLPGKAPDLPLVESIPSPWTGKPHNIGVTWWPGIRLPGPLHLTAVQSTSYWTPIAPPVGGGSTEEQTHIASLS